mgnify:CR=1 FL=1
MAIMQEIETKLQKGISVSTDEEVYYALLELVKDKAEKKVSNKGKKKLYYCLLYTSPSPRDCS